MKVRKKELRKLQTEIGRLQEEVKQLEKEKAKANRTLEIMN